MLDWLVYRRGLWRVYWGHCPVCNSDAPKIDSCSFCSSYRGYRDKKARAELRYEWAEFCGRAYEYFWT
jgi:hypothetical protein